MDHRPTPDLTDQQITWRPHQELIDRSRMLSFARSYGIDDYQGLCLAANEDPEWFWEAVVEHLGISWRRRFDDVLDTSAGIAWPRWFAGGRMNYVTSAVDRFLPARAAEAAVIWEGDDGRTRELTFTELAGEINRLSNALIELGAGPGERIAIYMPMITETAIAMLACGKIGAVFIPIFSGFGADAVRQRLVDAGVTILITSDGFRRRGNVIDLKSIADRAIEFGTSVQHVLVVEHAGNGPAMHEGRDHWLHDLVSRQSGDFEAVDTAADDPFMIIYTSGTTGKPKGAVHVHSGFPIKAAQDLAFCFDLQANDRLCWLTDLGWMMGPWAIAGTLIAGGTLVLYEGTADYPAPDRLWKFVERHRVNVLGVSPTAMRALMARGDEWVEGHGMDSLRAIGSTGEPWNPAPWTWTSERVGRGRCPIVNYSGGTEIGGGIVSSTTIHPQKPASFQGPVPGIPADVVDGDGNPVRGEVGELVIRGPWVGMTNGFLDDPERYLDTYWKAIPGMWTHGDWAYVDDEGFWYILGRSDDTMNIAGKRVGPAELESAAVAHPAVQEAAAIGVPDETKGTESVVFAILRTGSRDTPGIETEISDTIADHLGRPLRPKHVIVVDDLPRTRNAKIMRRVLRARYLGQSDLGDLSALENPEAVEAIQPVN